MEVPEIPRTDVPSEETLIAMFPDLGDQFEIDVWIKTLSKITPEAIQEQREITKNMILKRKAKIEMIKQARSKFTQLDFSATSSNLTTTAAPSRRKRQSDNSTADNSTSTDNNSTDNSTTAAPEPTTTTQVPKRVEVPAVLPNTHGYGIRAGNTTNLVDSVSCNTCGLPANRKRKFLYLSLTFDDDWTDVNSDKFKTKKLSIETEVRQNRLKICCIYYRSQKICEANNFCCCGYTHLCLVSNLNTSRAFCHSV